MRALMTKLNLNCFLQWHTVSDVHTHALCLVETQIWIMQASETYTPPISQQCSICMYTPACTRMNCKRFRHMFKEWDDAVQWTVYLHAKHSPAYFESFVFHELFHSVESECWRAEVQSHDNYSSFAVCLTRKKGSHLFWDACWGLIHMVHP